MSYIRIQSFSRGARKSKPLSRSSNMSWSSSSIPDTSSQASDFPSCSSVIGVDMKSPPPSLLSTGPSVASSTGNGSFGTSGSFSTSCSPGSVGVKAQGRGAMPKHFPDNGRSVRPIRCGHNPQNASTTAALDSTLNAKKATWAQAAANGTLLKGSARKVLRSIVFCRFSRALFRLDVLRFIFLLYL